MKKIALFAVLPFALFWEANAFADIVTLKDGRQITGHVQAGGGKEILIKVGDDSQVVEVDQIQSIQFDPTPGPASSSATSSATPAQPAKAAASDSITLPAGTEIAVRTIDRIDSKTADKYKEYAGSLDDPVVVDGVTVIPAEASAALRVSDVHSAGFARRASLSLTLVAVTINGHRVKVETSKVDSQSGSQAKRTAEAAGGGAAAGAAIGAAAGGAAGAGIGAGVGAAAGAVGGKVFGKTVDIHPETRFTYTLTQPVVINLRETSK